MGYLWVFVTEMEREWHYGLGYFNICPFLNMQPLFLKSYFFTYIPLSQISSAIYHENQRNMVAVNLTYKWLKMNI